LQNLISGKRDIGNYRCIELEKIAAPVLGI